MGLLVHVVKNIYQDTRSSIPDYFILDVEVMSGWINYRKSPKSISDLDALVYWSFNSFSLLIADLTVTADVVLQDKMNQSEKK